MATLSPFAHQLRCAFYAFDPDSTDRICPDHLGGRAWMKVEEKVKEIMEKGEGTFVRVALTASYVVPSDNPDMINDAKTCLIEDVQNAVKHDEIAVWVNEVPAPFATHDDVSSFLEGEEEDDDEDS